MGELALGDWLTTEVDSNGVGSWEAWCVVDGDGTVTVIFNVDIAIAAGGVPDLAGDGALAGFSSVDGDDGLFA